MLAASRFHGHTTADAGGISGLAGQTAALAPLKALDGLGQSSQSSRERAEYEQPGYKSKDDAGDYRPGAELDGSTLREFSERH